MLAQLTKAQPMSIINVEINDGEMHEYASGITAGEVLDNIYGKRSGAVSYTHLRAHET